MAEKIAQPNSQILPDVDAALVEVALVTYKNEFNQNVQQFALIGRNTVHLLNGQALGTSPNRERSGPAARPLRNAIFQALGRDIPPEGE